MSEPAPTGDVEAAHVDAADVEVSDDGDGRAWPGAAWPLPPVDEIEAMGLSVPLYLHALLEERPDPDRPDGPPLLVAELPALDHLVDPSGTWSTGAVVAAVDVIGGLVNGLAVLPDWVVTTNLTYRRVAPREADAHDGPLTLTARHLRKGRTSSVGATTVSRADGTQVATAVVTSSVLTPEAGPPSHRRPFRRADFAVPPLERYRSSPESFVGIGPGDRPGEVRFEVLPHLRNPWNIIQGGASAIAADAAARHAVAEAIGVEPSSLVVTDLVLHFVSPGRTGPVRARGEVLGGRADDHLVRVLVADEGADDRTIVVAVATVRPR
jgi:acyl-coenzyme A thioesterase PaaI-like protein